MEIITFESKAYKDLDNKITAIADYIFNVDIPHILWWLEGGVVGLALTIPMLIQVGHSDKKSLPIIAFNAILLGTLVGLAGHYISVF